MRANKKKGRDFKGRTLVTVMAPHSMVSEQFRTLRTNIEFSSPDKEIRSISVTSASASEGKSTTAANLAIVYAQTGKKVLLIDADMRKPTMHYTFGTTNRKGLSTVLTRQERLESAVNKTRISGLDLLTCGPIPPNPAELLASNAMDLLLAGLKNNYDIVIVDSPPILAVTDGQILANKCDGSILVLKSGKTDKDLALKAKGKILASNTTLIGVVLNNLSVPNNTYTLN
ncbi:CpsD/CapB family tyrosine-protein kinase [Planococcus sp. X10-3]|uniref:CpsD/CapB family tyrosine-protein kinase n=1 Tax=Planococcus sp. X10-3 TaxID=3061240 RepID=UPI003BB056A9